MKIADKKVLWESQDGRISQMELVSPYIARQAKPGQFIALMVSEEGERIPLTIVDTNTSEGTITIIFQELGFTTRLLGQLKTGDSLHSLVGPLGHPTEIKNYGRVILVGGGVGIAEIYPVAKALKKVGNHISTILGARTKALLLLESELRQASDECYLITDDGSSGRKGFTTHILAQLLTERAFDLVYAVGPLPMMHKVAAVTKEYSVKTIVSLNTLMVDATGMCGGCRVDIDGKTKFSCVDGPEFDAHLVDWNTLAKRSKMYIEQEKHICNLARVAGTIK
jgi:ferredoxin/flavodoxin---NADP+ reductase